jgi:hypothetical protein
MVSKSDIINSATVHLTEITKNGIVIIAEYFTAHIPYDAFNQLKEVLNFSVKDLLEQQGIDMASAANTFTIINEARESNQ